MYSSLDRVDLVLDAEDGAVVHCQTDHRSTEEIAEAPELSVLFAVARVVNARRTVGAEAQPGTVRVAYLARCEPTELLGRVLGLLGAELFVDQQPREATERPGSVDDVLNEQILALAERVRSARGLAFDAASLETLTRLFDTTPAAEEDEEIHWTRVFELGAFAGRVLSNLTHARWLVAETRGAVPFVLKIEPPGTTLTLDLMNAAQASISGAPDTIVKLVAKAREKLRELQ